MRFYLHIISTLLLTAMPSAALAGMTLLTGPPTCSHTGNLVTNGSFEDNLPGPSNLLYWASGTTNTPFGTPSGWSSLGPADNYAVWGASSVSSPWDLELSDTIPDGNAALYFGNGITTFDQPASFNADGSVTYPATPNSSKGAPVKLWQTVPTDVFVAPSYCLGFWVSGEAASTNFGWLEGVFGLNVTNVLAGDPDQYFAVPSGNGPQGISRYYEFSLTPLNPLAPIKIEFINWGHVVNSGMATELVLDDVMVNAVPEPGGLIVLGIGCISLLIKRRDFAIWRALPRSGLPNPSSVRRGFVAALCLFMTHQAVQASFTQNTGVQIATPTGNLVTNGSFETGVPSPGFANQVYWATGTTNTPFAVPSGWTSSGQSQSYALWGSDSAGGGLIFSDTIPDGSAAMYFGNATTTVTPSPSFGPNHTVTFGSPETFTPTYGGPVKLSQAVQTQLSPAPSYVLNFWVSGEDASFTGFAQEGVFGLKVTNVLAGDPQMYFAIPNSAINPSYRLEFFFTPLNSLLPVTVEFTNWGHIDNTPNGQIDSTELVLDDVIVNALPEPASLLMLGVGSLLLLKRRGRVTQYFSFSNRN